MKNVNNSNTRLILLHPYIQKQESSNRLWLLAFISFLTTAFVVTLIYTREYSTTAVASAATTTFSPTTTAYSNAPLPSTVINTPPSLCIQVQRLFPHVPYPELKPFSDVMRKCSSPCNFLVFGLTHETFLWKALKPSLRSEVPHG